MTSITEQYKNFSDKKLQAIEKKDRGIRGGVAAKILEKRAKKKRKDNFFGKPMNFGGKI